MAQAGFNYLRQFQIADRSVVVRRYLTAEKLRRLVESRALYFSRAAKFDDPLDGFAHFRDYVEQDIALKRDGFTWRERLTAWQTKRKITECNRKVVLISRRKQ